MRRTTNRPGACSLGGERGEGHLGDLGWDTHVPLISSKMASVCLMGVHASSPMVAISALISGSRRTVTDTSAPPRSAAPTVGAPENAESARSSGLA